MGLLMPTAIKRNRPVHTGLTIRAGVLRNPRKIHDEDAVQTICKNLQLNTKLGIRTKIRL